MKYLVSDNDPGRTILYEFRNHLIAEFGENRILTICSVNNRSFIVPLCTIKSSLTNPFLRPKFVAILTASLLEISVLTFKIFALRVLHYVTQP
jgi:hypothetical protein